MATIEINDMDSFINKLADAVAARIDRKREVRLDLEYLISLPPDEQIRIQREKMRRKRQ